MAYVANDSYCATSDVEALTGAGAYGAGTTPTLQAVLNFQAHRAAQLYQILAERMGTSAPGPASYATTIDTGTDKGKALEAVLIHFNAIGAAMDALIAAGASTAPKNSNRVEELFGMWERREAVVTAAAESYLGSGSGVASHISVGEITLPTTTSREGNFTFTSDTDW